MNGIKNEHIAILFKALNQILDNQDKLNRFFAINTHDSEYGWSDAWTNKLANQCWNAACEYESEDE